MYKIKRVEIEGFWQKFCIKSNFNEEVNIVIGNNGTGKTTFMNILNAVLSVDTNGLSDNDFSSIYILLSYKNKTRTIRVVKKIDESDCSIDYYIGRKKFAFPLILEEPRGTSYFRRRAMSETIDKIKNELLSMVSLASLSVYRYRAADIESPDRNIHKRFAGPVDFRLQELMQGLTAYQLELSQKAREISANLQKEVLMSLLYRPDSEQSQVGYALDFNAEKERLALISAYGQLGITGAQLIRKVNEHISAVGSTVGKIKEIINKGNQDSSSGTPLDAIDLAPLEASKRAGVVSKMSLAAESKINEIFSPIHLFLDKLHSFIENKKFGFENGRLVLKNSSEITIHKLSSGEKQLLILLTEALLQRKAAFIFLADEPELSLHISWQRQIIPAVRSLNPSAQIIVATHSPEIAGRFPNSIIDMADVIHVEE